MSNITLINEIWKLLKSSIELGDAGDAAEILVNYLVEEGYSAHEIKQTFRSDKNIKSALDYYLETPDSGINEDSIDDGYDDLFYDEDEQYDDYYDR